jgi:endoglucanase
VLLLTASPGWCGEAEAGGGEVSIKLNQVGFYPSGRKSAVVPAAQASRFQVTSEDGATVFYQGYLAPVQRWPYSEEEVQTADFSSLDLPGRYRVVVPGIGRSFPFEVGSSIHRPLVVAALRSFYYNRSGLELEERFAGRWARPAGHPDRDVLIHASAASESRPEGSTIASPGGWYNAEDYNKYIISSSIATYTLLAAWEHFPEVFRDLEANIPESGNGVPDIIDEAVWSLRWMLTMQDPGDGGVYHKLSGKGFAGFLPSEFPMPHEARDPRYLFQKSTAAALDFAAATAAASRILPNWPQYESLAQDCLVAARSAWDWARQNPNVLFEQPEDVITGAYAYDYEKLVDEPAWAAVELYLSTGETTFLDGLNLATVESGVPSWDWVSPLAWISLAHHTARPPGLPEGWVERRILSVADRLRSEYESSAYSVSMGAYPKRFLSGQNEADFSWGSNSMAAYQGMVLLAAFELTGYRGYLKAALACLDYLLGRNATGYCFVTGFGSRRPQRIRHRPSVADGIAEPVPGFLVGGPHGGLQDANYCEGLYRWTTPARAYVDDECSFATNGVAINWNAPLVYIAGALEHLMVAED